MSLEKFAPRDIPFQASNSLREYLADQMQRLQPLVNNAAQKEDDEVISGEWDFSGEIDFLADVNIAGQLASSNTDALAVQINGTLHHSRNRFTAMNRWVNTSDSNRIQTSWRTESATGSFWGFLPEPGGVADLAAGFGYDFNSDEWIIDNATDFRVKRNAFFDSYITVAQPGNLFTDSAIRISGDAASIMFNETDQTGGDEAIWTWGVGTREFRLRTFTDALGAGADPISVTRTDNSTAIDEVELNATNLDFNGLVTLNSLLTLEDVDILLDGTNDLRLSCSGNSQLALTSGSANANLDLNAIDSGTGTCSVRVGRQTNTSGINRLVVLRGNNSTSLAISMEGRGSAAAGGALFIAEGAAAHSSRAGQGHLWVKNTTPCELWFTDDAGNDTQIV